MPMFSLRISSDLDKTSESEPSPDSSSNFDPDSDPFKSHLSQVRLYYCSDIGEKVEQQIVKRKGYSSLSSSLMYLLPVPLKDPVSRRMKVDFGFSLYNERINRRIVILVLMTLVELATKKGVMKYNMTTIVLIQVYFVMVVEALFIKYEKEKVGVCS